MISGVNIISRNAIVANLNGAGGSEGCCEPLSEGFRGQSPQRIFLGSKEHLE